MTTPTLHPAAVKAANHIEDRVRSEHKVTFNLSLLEAEIHAAIDDHLKSEGWVELRKAADKISHLLETEKAVVWVNAEAVELREALRRLPGEKS